MTGVVAAAEIPAARAVNESTESRRAALIAAAALVVAVVCYRPWDPAPLPLRDFGGTIALLSSTSNVTDAYERLMASYTSDGRFQPAFMMSFAAQWAVFGAQSVGWQVVRFLVMSGLLLLAITFAVRCGATWIAAATAMSLWLVASGGHEAWILMQIAEPFAALFVMVAAVLATFWRSSSRSVALAIAIALCLVVAVLSKETMLVAVPLVLGVALCREGRTWTTPELSWRSVLLLLIVTLAVGLFGLAPILTTRSQALPGAYAGRFGLEAIGVGTISNAARAILLPVTRVPWFPANVLYGAVLLAGWTLLFRENRRATTIAAAVLLSFPIGGILLYSAWPAFPGYYAMPFALSLGTLLALALTALARPRPVVARVAFAAVVIVGVYGALLAWNGAQADRAIRRTDWAAVQMLRELPETSRIIVGVPDPARSGGVGRSLSAYAAAVHSGTPRFAEDVRCSDATAKHGASTGAAVFLFSNLCERSTVSGQPPSARAVERYTQIDWKNFRPHTAENSVSLWLTPAG